MPALIWTEVITRETNEVTDLIKGVTLTVKSQQALQKPFLALMMRHWPKPPCRSWLIRSTQ